MTTILIIFCLKFRGHIPFYKVPPPKTPLCFDFRFLVTFCWICIPSMKALYYIFLKSRVMFVSLSTTLVWLCNNQFKKKKVIKKLIMGNECDAQKKKVEKIIMIFILWYKPLFSCFIISSTISPSSSPLPPKINVLSLLNLYANVSPSPSLINAKKISLKMPVKN